MLFIDDILLYAKSSVMHLYVVRAKIRCIVAECVKPSIGTNMPSSVCLMKVKRIPFNCAALLSLKIQGSLGFPLVKI